MSEQRELQEKRTIGSILAVRNDLVESSNQVGIEVVKSDFDIIKEYFLKNYIPLETLGSFKRVFDRIDQEFYRLSNPKNQN